MTHGSRGVCLDCRGEIEFIEASQWNGQDFDVFDAWWAHRNHPADGHDAAPLLCSFCSTPAQLEHAPCCNAHSKPLCCRHYCLAHFVEVDQCSPQTHSNATRKA